MKKTTKAFIALMILIGGLLMVFSLNGKITEEQQKKDLETSIAKLLVHDYEGVKTIKFTGWGHSRETGSWGTIVVINGENEIGFSFDGLSSLEEISSIVSDENIQLTESENAIENPRIRDRISRIQKTSLKGIDIIYSEDDKEK
ncbi:TPA: hypothetical protein TUL06_001692 [Streptococcus equi subsp. zooepidemicus]|uniref:Putative exported protein n=1 Tax=Streptococcus equi subsp. zooepidemicus (strain H70) TaxID=553483 RepID=C0MER8_STRS7|nr:hypothetical protein [Streptococcus equi]VED84737.1 membrane protein [Streptococcus equi subsp. equi]MCD3389816.1 hypothetical protein [Streptococcus equi subsp. zooepidemicus]MCD3402013.1 hypothetical protein [Streptococcus equi subsp. zooepidemicus]MCD3452093.1 hypothetical protein [Streptococcus equi subsp. zooepidemicus]MCD3465096.1 hypothetical protein [Streptococcus equi subsp. zooepidemicus]